MSFQNWHHLKSAELKKYEVKSTEELFLIARKIDLKMEEKLTCAFQNDVRNLANFYKLKNSVVILESKMAKLNQNKN